MHCDHTFCGCSQFVHLPRTAVTAIKGYYYISFPRNHLYIQVDLVCVKFKGHA
jgi:hypothetical protein